MNQAASAFSVTGAEVNERIFAPPAEALEIVPGLIITQHSGDGKANQYFLRGFNLDHGTDFAIARRRYAGQHADPCPWAGLCRPQLPDPGTGRSVDIKKGPYYAEDGDFASVGAVHVDLRDAFQRADLKTTIGGFGHDRYLGIGSSQVGEGNPLVAGEVAATTALGPTPTIEQAQRRRPLQSKAPPRPVSP